MNQLTFNLIVGTIIRSGLMLLAGWLAAKGVLPTGTVEEWVAAVLLVVLTLLWSLWQKLQVKWHIDAALSAPSGSTLKDAVDLAKGDK